MSRITHCMHLGKSGSFPVGFRIGQRGWQCGTGRTIPNKFGRGIRRIGENCGFCGVDARTKNNLA